MTTQETTVDNGMDIAVKVTVTFRLEGDNGRALMQALDDVFKNHGVSPVVVLCEEDSNLRIFDVLKVHRQRYGGELVQLLVALWGMGINTAAELAAYPVDDLLSNPEIGEAGLERLRQALALQHMRLAGE